MSTTSCPRCSAQVTLPVGVSNDTTVRCPLCHAHYTLADALVNMPPLLEVVEDADDALAADWYDAGDPAGKSIAAAALPEDDASEADTLEMGSLELDSLELDAAEDFDGDAQDKETIVDDLTMSTLEPAPARRQEPVAEDDDGLLDFDAPAALPVEDDELTAGDLTDDGEEDLSLDFGGDALSTEESGAETLEFTPGMVDSFDEKSEDEVKFDLESEEDLPAEEAATIEFGAPLDDDGPLFGSEEGEVKFDFDAADDQAETVRFASPTTASGDEEVEFNFDAPEADSVDGEGLRGFEDIHVAPSSDAEDIPLDLPVAAVAAMPVPTEEAAAGKKGKKEKKKKEKKPKAVNAGDKPRRSLAGMLVGLLLAIPAALYGALWLGPDYDILGVGKFLPSAMLPAEFSKKKPVQLALAPPSAAPSIPAAAPPAEELPSDDQVPAEPAVTEDTTAPADPTATEHSAARPVEEPAASPATDESPAAAAPAEAMPGDAPTSETPTLTAPSDAAPAPAASATTPAEDPFAPATAAPATAPTDSPAEADPFAPTEAPAATPADDPFAPAKTDEAPAAGKPAEEKPAAAPAADDLFAPETAPAAAQPAPAPALESPSEPEMPADQQAPAEADPFAPAETPAPAATRPAEEDPFAPAPADKPAEMPAEDPAAPTDKPAEEDIVAPAPEVMPETRPADADPFAPAPADKPAAEALPSPVAPADAPAATEPTIPSAPTTPVTPAEALGPRNVADVSPAALQGAVQSTFVSSQQLMAAEATGDEAQLRKARAAFYVNLFGMADAITSAQLGDGGAAVDQQLQSLGPVIRQQLATDPKRLEALKVFGARWLGFPKRTTNGVVVSGTVESAEQVGKLFHTKARLGSAADAPLVTIVTAEKPDVASGDVVLALGSIVDDPQQKLSGYEGSEPAVVWSGMTMKVAP